MGIARDIQPVTYFCRKPAEAVKHLKATRRPMLLTINSKPEVVVQDVRSYQHLLDIVAQADAGEGIRQGLDHVVGRRTRPASQVFDEIRREYRATRPL